MPFDTNLIEPLLEEVMYYEPGNVEVESFEEVAPGRFKIDLHLEEAPRDESEIFSGSDSSYSINVVTGHSDHDNGPTDSVIRAVLIIDRSLEPEDSNDATVLEDISFEKMTIALCGNLSAPDYCDDETDASLYGTMFVEIDGMDWALEESRKECCDMLGRAVAETMRTLTNQIRTLREIGETRPIAIEETKTMVRHALAA